MKPINAQRIQCARVNRGIVRHGFSDYFNVKRFLEEKWPKR
jgi:hypothetical protein